MKFVITLDHALQPELASVDLPTRLSSRVVSAHPSDYEVPSTFTKSLFIAYVRS